MPRLQRRQDADEGNTAACAMQWALIPGTDKTDMRDPGIMMPSLTENSFALRNDILLPKSPFSCIVVYERGLRICPESPLLNHTYPAAVSTPLISAIIKQQDQSFEIL
jgi:hypothetical protein